MTSKTTRSEYPSDTFFRVLLSLLICRWSTFVTEKSQRNDKKLSRNVPEATKLESLFSSSTVSRKDPYEKFGIFDRSRSKIRIKLSKPEPHPRPRSFEPQDSAQYNNDCAQN